MAILYKKNRALGRIMRNKFRVPALPARRLEPAATPAPAAASPLSVSIPQNYNDVYVRAIPSDPRSTFVYWEMPKAAAEECGMAESGNAHTGSGEAAAMERKVRDNCGLGGNGDSCHSGNDNKRQFFNFQDNSWHWGDGDGGRRHDGNCRQHNDNGGRGGNHGHDTCSHTDNHNGHGEYSHTDNHNGHNAHSHTDNHNGHGVHSHTDNHNGHGTYSHTDNHNEHGAHYHTDNHNGHDTYSHTDNRHPRNGGDRHGEYFHNNIVLPHLSSGILYDGKRRSP